MYHLCTVSWIEVSTVKKGIIAVGEVETVAPILAITIIMHQRMVGTEQEVVVILVVVEGYTRSIITHQVIIYSEYSTRKVYQ